MRHPYSFNPDLIDILSYYKKTTVNHDSWRSMESPSSPHPFESNPIFHMMKKESEQKKTSIIFEIKSFLERTVTDFECGNLYLPDANVINLQSHYLNFKEKIAFCSQQFEHNNIILEENLEYEFYKCTFHRPIEFYLLMEKKGIIRINKISGKGIIVTFNVELLRDFKEMDDLFLNWLTFGELAFNKETGHSRNGNLAKKVFIKNSAAFRAMSVLMNHWSTVTYFDELQRACYDKDDQYTEKSRIDDRITALIDKQIRAGLKLKHPDSKVNILGVDGGFKLSALPANQ